MTKKKKGFFGKLIGKLDKKMEEKATKSCCCTKEKETKKSCCK